MSYTAKPGTGALFKNDKKAKDIQPDYKGSICLPDGRTCTLAGWVSQGANGKYLTLKVGSILGIAADADGVLPD